MQEGTEKLSSFFITNYLPLTQNSTTETRTWELSCTYPTLSRCRSVAVAFQRVLRLSITCADKFLLLIAKNNLPQQSNAWKTGQSCKLLQSVEMREQESLLIYKSSDNSWVSFVTLATTLKISVAVLQLWFGHVSQDYPWCLGEAGVQQFKGFFLHYQRIWVEMTSRRELPGRLGDVFFDMIFISEFILMSY